MAVHPIGMMRHEHINHGVQLEKLAELTTQHQPPSGACNTWQALYAGTARLNEDLIEHIHLENNYLFPQFEQISQTSHCV
jgi:regulator of cell morphogenesis and NO signaling